MNAHAPPKEKRGCNTALNTADKEILFAMRRKVNRARYVWSPEAIRLLSSFRRTGGVKHLAAAHCHIAAMCAQLESSAA
jgi:hypothetical protein